MMMFFQFFDKNVNKPLQSVTSFNVIFTTSKAEIKPC